MTKQEKIREGVRDIIEGYFDCDSEATYQHFRDEILDYLHSAGCVLKVERELPKRTKYYTSEESDIVCGGGFSNALALIKRAGYEAVVPLIEEDAKHLMENSQSDR